MAGPSGNETNHQLDGLTIRGGLALVGVGGVTTYLNQDVAAACARAAVMTRAQGCYTETLPLTGIIAQSAGVSGTVYGNGIGLLAGDVITNITVRVATAGSVLTLVRLGLYSKTGTLLCQTAEVSASFAASGVKTIAVTTPFTITADDLYYASIISVGTTAPALLRGHSFYGAANAGSGVGAGVAQEVLMLAQADLPAAATFVTSTSGITYWFGFS